MSSFSFFLFLFKKITIFRHVVSIIWSQEEPKTDLKQQTQLELCTSLSEEISGNPTAYLKKCLDFDD